VSRNRKRVQTRIEYKPESGSLKRNRVQISGSRNRCGDQIGLSGTAGPTPGVHCDQVARSGTLYNGHERSIRHYQSFQKRFQEQRQLADPSPPNRLPMKEACDTERILWKFLLEMVEIVSNFLYGFILRAVGTHDCYLWPITSQPLQKHVAFQECFYTLEPPIGQLRRHVRLTLRN
jgi:hypothetical protein